MAGTSIRYHDARTFTAGAACGFLAGAFVVCTVVWQFGNVIGSRQAVRAAPARPQAAVNRWLSGMEDAGPGVLERADEAVPASMMGRGDPGPAVAAAPIGSSPGSPGEMADSTSRDAGGGGQQGTADAAVSRPAWLQPRARGHRHPGAAQHSSPGCRGWPDRSSLPQQAWRHHRLPVRSRPGSIATTTPTSRGTPTACARANR